MAAFECGAALRVGARVCDGDGFKATVQYVGPVVAAANKEEIWLGVEWDVKTRGKHDGSCVDDMGKVHRYFRCDPGAGSFIRPTKVSGGRPLSQSLGERYVSLDSKKIVEEDGKIPNAFVSTSKGQKPIEFVGERQIRERQQLSTLLKASARNDGVSTIDDVAVIAGHLQEFDLQDNLLSCWSEVFKLGDQLPQLGCLLLHGNRMLPLDHETSATLPSGAFSQLKVLALNSCGLTSWQTVQRLEAFLPALEELYLAHNTLPDLPGAEDEATVGAQQLVHGFSQLRVLDVAGCGLRAWEQVKAFGALPNLRELLLDLNPLAHAQACDANTFVQLLRLSVAETALGSWSDIDMLNSFPALQVLRMSAIPLFNGKGASEVRPLVIARLPAITQFNGSVVSPKERENAEKAYLRLILRELDMQGAQEDPIKTEGVLRLVHPRFPDLRARYAEDLQQLASTGTAKTLSAEVVSVTFKNLSFGSGGSLEPIQKRVPRSLTVARLQLLVKQLFGLDPSLQKLSLRVYKDSPPMLLDDEEATLAYYGAIDGADIFINE